MGARKRDSLVMRQSADVLPVLNPRKKKKKRHLRETRLMRRAKEGVDIGVDLDDWPIPIMSNPGASKRDVMLIAVMAGLVSALLPSVPTLVRYAGDTTEISVFGCKMPYNTFLKWWVLASAVGLGLVWWKFRKGD